MKSDKVHENLLFKHKPFKFKQKNDQSHLKLINIYFPFVTIGWFHLNILLLVATTTSIIPMVGPKVDLEKRVKTLH